MNDNLDRVCSITDIWGYDESFHKQFMPRCTTVLEEVFKARVHCLDRGPWEHPRIFVANHASFLPLDALAIQCLLGPMASRQPIRPLLEDYVFTLPYIGLWMSRLGSVRACQENATLLLQHGYSVIAFPEGVKGAGKTIFERNRIERFGRGGLVRLAIRTGVQVVPVGISGPERSYPLLAKLERIGRAAGLPFLPVTPTFPWLGLLGLLPLPSQITIFVGPSIDLRAEAGLPSHGEIAQEDMPDEATTLRLNEVVRGWVIDLARRARQQKQ